MIKDLTDTGRVASFWWISFDGAQKAHGCRGGVNFENTYVSISSSFESEHFACERAPKSPSRNFYAFVSSSLSY